MIFEYKLPLNSWTEVQKRHFSENEFLNKQNNVMQIFFDKLANFQILLEKPRDELNSDEYDDCMFSHIRYLKSSLIENSAYLPQTVISQELVNFLCFLHKYPNSGVQIEMLDFLNKIIFFLKFEHPLLIFENNKDNLIEMLQYMVSRNNHQQITPRVLTFFTYIYDGKEDTFNFINSILPLNDLQLLLSNPKYYQVLQQTTELILKFTSFYIPSNKLQILIPSIKLILEVPSKHSLNCFKSLRNIVNYYQKYERIEDKQLVKYIFENDEELPEFCFNYMNEIKIAKNQCSIFSFILELCKNRFLLKKNQDESARKSYLDIFKLIPAALDRSRNMDSIFPDDDSIKIYACSILYYAYSDDNYHSSFLLSNASRYIDKLIKLIEEDDFSVAFTACQTLFEILVRLPITELEKTIFKCDLFYVVKRIIDFDNFDVKILMKALNHIFNIAEKQKWYQRCINEFKESSCYDCLYNLMMNSDNENDYNNINQFITHFDEVYKNIKNKK